MATLTLLLEEREPHLLCLGGSSVSERRNPMSDTDLFAIGPADGQDRFRRLAGLFPKADLEWRPAAWLDAIAPALERFSPDIATGPSPFAYADLRFLARIVLGVRLAERGGLGARVADLREPLRRALAAYMSTYYVNTYEDVLGLYRAGRHRDVLPLAGELAQRAALLGLLQVRLAEPASKWALGIARTGGPPGLSAAAERMLAHLGAFAAGRPSAWAAGLLQRANALVAAGMIAALGPETGAADLAGQPRPSEGLCLMGAPGYLTLIDLDRSQVSVCNRAFLALYADEAAPAFA